MNIEVDDREQHRIDTAKKEFVKHEVELKHLETADYIFNKDVAFEYKTLPDFIHSVQSGRIVEQAIRLNQEFKYPFVMIQSSEQELKSYINKIFFLRKTKKKNKPQKFYQKNYYGAIDSLNTYVTVIERPTEHYCFQSMLNTAIKSLRNEPINRKVVKTGNPAYNFLRYCIQGVGPKTAQKIVNELNLKNPKDIFKITVDEIADIKGISRGKAEVIFKNINS